MWIKHRNHLDLQRTKEKIIYREVTIQRMP